MLLEEYKRTGKAPTLIQKIEAETNLRELKAMQASCIARGRELTMDEMSAFARRHIELVKAAGGAV